MRIHRRQCIGLLALPVGVICLCLVGCGAGSGDVTGTVTYNGEHLKGGTVTFASTTGGPSFTSPINEDGTYTLRGVAGGDYKVCVETESLKPHTATGGPSMGRGSGSSSKGGRGGKSGPPGSGGPPGGPPDLLKDVKSGKIKTGPPGDSSEPEDVKAKRGKDGFAYMADNLRRYVSIPTDYANPDTTQLSYKATKGPQTFDIAIAPK